MLDTVRDGRPELVVLAWDAPGGPAREVIAALRADDDTRETKVMLLVDYRHASRDDVAAAGADDQLRAPFSPLQLQVKLRRLVSDEAGASAATAAAAG